MTIEELFAEAKREIFGVPPESKIELIGYNLAVNALSYVIPEAECALQKFGVPTKSLRTCIDNSHRLLTAPAFNSFPEDTIKVFHRCIRNFHKRYEPLMKAA